VQGSQDADSLEAEVARRTRDDGLLVPRERVLVAVSAGADSTALAALLVFASGRGLALDVVLGHVDHGWRGPAEAAADVVTLAALARRLHVPLVVAPPPEVVRRTEDDARRHRYASLSRLARENRCTKIATAHHLRDQAETFLMRLLRGSGSAGLSGIPARRPLDGGPLEVVRPLLHVHPSRLRSYLAVRDLAWREDATNATLDRDRAVVRRKLVAAEARGSALSRDLAEAATRFRRALTRRERDVEVRLGPSLRVHPLAGAVEVTLANARSLRTADWPTGLRVLGRAIAADADGPWFQRVHSDLVARLVGDGADGAALDLPQGRRIARSGSRLLLSVAEPPMLPTTTYVGEGAWKTSAGSHDLTVSRRRVANADFDVARWAADRRAGATVTPAAFPTAAAFDDRVLGPSITFRFARPGDRFEPLGAIPHAIEVETFLAKQGVPAIVRRGTLVVEAADGVIAWVVGHRIDRRFAVHFETARVTLVEINVRPP
jgi:tRNA(Ile)-lysidine synthase